MKIAYLNAEDSSNLVVEVEKVGNSVIDTTNYEKARFNAIVNHPNVEIYTIEEFSLAFNDEVISDLGLIAPLDDNGKLL